MAIGSTSRGPLAPFDPPNSADVLVGRLFDSYRQQAFNLAYRLSAPARGCGGCRPRCLHPGDAGGARQRSSPPRAARLGPWLLKIVANVALGQLRRRRRGLSLSLDEIPTEAPAIADDPLTAVVRREQRGDVLTALLSLSDSQRAALTLREYQGLTYVEIGELLDLDVSATTALLYRARAGFRQAYEGLSSNGSPTGLPRACAADLGDAGSGARAGHLEPRRWAPRGVPALSARGSRQLRRVRRLHGLIPLLAPPSGWTSASIIETFGRFGATQAPVVAARPPTQEVAAVSGAVVAVTGALLGGSGGPACTGLGMLGGAVASKLASLVLAAGLSAAVVLATPATDQVEIRQQATTELTSPSVQASQGDPFAGQIVPAAGPGSERATGDRPSSDQSIARLVGAVGAVLPPPAAQTSSLRPEPSADGALAGQIVARAAAEAAPVVSGPIVAQAEASPASPVLSATVPVVQPPSSDPTTSAQSVLTADTSPANGGAQPENPPAALAVASQPAVPDPAAAPASGPPAVSAPVSPPDAGLTASAPPAEPSVAVVPAPHPAVAPVPSDLAAPPPVEPPVANVQLAEVPAEVPAARPAAAPPVETAPQAPSRNSPPSAPPATARIEPRAGGAAGHGGCRGQSVAPVAAARPRAAGSRAGPH